MGCNQSPTGRREGSGVYTSGSGWVRPSDIKWLADTSMLYPTSNLPQAPNHQVDCRKGSWERGPPPPSCPEVLGKETQSQPRELAGREGERYLGWRQGPGSQQSCEEAKLPLPIVQGLSFHEPQPHALASGVRPPGASKWPNGERRDPGPKLARGHGGSHTLYHSS